MRWPRPARVPLFSLGLKVARGPCGLSGRLLTHYRQREVRNSIYRYRKIHIDYRSKFLYRFISPISIIYGNTNYDPVHWCISVSFIICRAGVLVLAVLEYWIYCTCTVLVLMRTKVIVLVLVLVLVDKYSGTRTSTGMSTDILWYISCKGKNHHTCEINSLTYHEGKVPNWFILLLWLNIWYMGCDCKFHNAFQFYYHWKINWITIMKFWFIVVIRRSPFSHLTSGWCMKIFTSDFKKKLFSTYFLILRNICFLFLNWQHVVIVSHDSQ